MARKGEVAEQAQASEVDSAAAIEWHRERAGMGIVLQRYALRLAESGDQKAGALVLNAAMRIVRAKPGKGC